MLNTFVFNTLLLLLLLLLLLCYVYLCVCGIILFYSCLSWCFLALVDLAGGKVIKFLLQCTHNSIRSNYLLLLLFFLNRHSHNNILSISYLINDAQYRFRLIPFINI